MSHPTRRTVVGAAVWTIPAIQIAVAAPAAAASTPPPPPPVCVDPTGLKIQPAPGSPWKENSGEGFTLVKGDEILIVNEGPYEKITVPITVWTSNQQEGISLVDASGRLVLDVPKSGNRATIPIQVYTEPYFVLTVIATSKDAEAHVIVGCDKGFILKSSR